MSTLGIIGWALAIVFGAILLWLAYAFFKFWLNFWNR